MLTIRTLQALFVALLLGLVLQGAQVATDRLAAGPFIDPNGLERADDPADSEAGPFIDPNGGRIAVVRAHHGEAGPFIDPNGGRIAAA